MTTFLLFSVILALVVVAWLFRQRLIRFVPRKDTMFTVTLIASIDINAVLEPTA